MPRHEEMINEALRLHQLGEVGKAIEIYLNVASENKNNSQLMFLLGTAFHQTADSNQALNFLQQSIALDPYNPHAWNNLGEVYRHLGDPKEAIKNYKEAIRLKPDLAESFFNLGNAQKNTGNVSEAIINFKKAASIRPDFCEAHNNLGNALLEADQLEDALKCYDKCIELQPSFAAAHNNRGNALKKKHDLHGALMSYKRAIEINADYSDAYANCGIILTELADFTDAIPFYDKAIALNGNSADFFNYRGVAYAELKQIDIALLDYNKSLWLNPNHAEALNNRGNALLILNRAPEAILDYQKAIELKSNFVEAFNNLGNAFMRIGDLDKAIENYDRALSLKSDYAAAFNNRGNAFRELKRLNEALDNYKKALGVNPHYPFLLGAKNHILMHLVDWEEFPSLKVELREKISTGLCVAPPFCVLGFIDEPAIQKTAAEEFIKATFDGVSARKIDKCYDSKKIKLGYFSADFHNHATMHLISEILENHDRSKFELIGFSFGPRTYDEWHERAKGAFSQFIDCNTKSDGEIAEFARSLFIDIAVDLKGLTVDYRTGIFAHRAASIQVNYLGYPGTMGAPFIDYIIADHFLIPEHNRTHYSEKICYLPNCYQPNARKVPISDLLVGRQDFGLPVNKIVFCSFNNQWKITPDIFGIWMDILNAVDGSVLWIIVYNLSARDNLRKEAKQRGIDERRLVFAESMPIEKHLSRLALADIMLDTFPYGAHTTCSDALRMGVPVITMIGESFASRVSGSLLATIGLSELITRSREDYRELAIYLANNPSELNRVKGKLLKQRETSALFDSEKYTRDIEGLYKKMVERYRNGLDPDHLCAD